mmetsp:Transcript_112883/g.320165  ORF Transcript_112883/g.320165 Transcript_112883/m.320165 type:complete len:287 (+) Transcript_112883:493-1353(+)
MSSISELKNITARFIFATMPTMVAMTYAHTKATSIVETVLATYSRKFCGQISPKPTEVIVMTAQYNAIEYTQKRFSDTEGVQGSPGPSGPSIRSESHDRSYLTPKRVEISPPTWTASTPTHMHAIKWQTNTTTMMNLMISMTFGEKPNVTWTRITCFEIRSVLCSCRKRRRRRLRSIASARAPTPWPVMQDSGCSKRGPVATRSIQNQPACPPWLSGRAQYLCAILHLSSSQTAPSRELSTLKALKKFRTMSTRKTESMTVLGKFSGLRAPDFPPVAKTMTSSGTR